MDYLIVGFAGCGEVAQENVNALLDDQMTAWDDQYKDYTIVIAGKPGRSEKGTKAVRNFLEDDDLGLSEEDYESMVVDELESKDVISVMVEMMEKDKHDLLLILAPKIDEDGSADELTEKLMEDATANDIPVKDLTHALDDLIFEDDDSDVSEEEPEADPKKLEEEKKVTVPPTSEAPSLPVSEPDEAQATREVSFAALGAWDVPNDIERQIATLIGDLVRAEVNKAIANLDGNPLKPKEEAVLASEQLDDDDEMVTVLENPADGTWRKKGRGRPRKDEIIHEMTKKEARSHGVDV